MIVCLVIVTYSLDIVLQMCSLRLRTVPLMLLLLDIYILLLDMPKSKGAMLLTQCHAQHIVKIIYFPSCFL
jgi:hypothetical protein